MPEAGAPLDRLQGVTTDTAVEAHELVKIFKGDVRALDGLSLEVRAGSVLGLLGPNGAGKTTVVRILSTILRPDRGRAAILGHDVVREAGWVRRIIGLAGQYATVDENLTGRENIRMVGRLSHMAKAASLQRADALLDQFGLTDAGNRPVRTYSGGMRRRLDLAASLVGRPPVLFLDEPTTGLDPQSRQDLWAIIEDLVRAGTTVLLTTQYLEEADRLAERIVVVDHGRVIAEGTPAELKADLGTTVVSITFASEDEAQRAAVVLEGRAGMPGFADGGRSARPLMDGTTIELTVEEGPRVAADVLRALDQHHVAVAGLALREPSLDDVFLNLTGHRAEPDTGGDLEADGHAGPRDGAVPAAGRADARTTAPAEPATSSGETVR